MMAVDVPIQSGVTPTGLLALDGVSLGDLLAGARQARPDATLTTVLDRLLDVDAQAAVVPARFGSAV